MAPVTAIPTTPILFYDSGTCPFAQRTWITLLEKQLNFQHKIVDLKNKPKHFTELYATIHPDPAAPAKVPIIIDGPDKLIESNLVSEYLDRKYGDASSKLFPDDPYKLAKVRWFVDLFSELFLPNLFGMLRADSQEALDEVKEKFDNGLKLLNKFVEQHSFEGGDFFLGADYSFAEVAATPFVQRASVALPEYRGYSLELAFKQHNLARLQAWYKAASERPSHQQTAPEPEQLIASWSKFVGEFRGHVKQ